ncbi:unnamed protein product [Strongylus vulgaris]|uniref:Lipid-binding serum glycoprotein N-terminal domain-containing protein n=1 Tax=Strongylus vulgaris TaxID=40348 RepID=A0A3P7IKZ5_STRVU|nr:unnamed protein product [Strongylus vulgaris]
MSFQARNVSFSGVITVQVTVGLFATIQGRVWVTSKDSRVDVTLNWNDFDISPETKLSLDLNITFTHDLYMANILKPIIEKTVSSLLNSYLPKQVTKLTKTKLNPLLHKAKQLLTENMGDGWAVQLSTQDQHLQIALKPRRYANSMFRG